VVETGRRTDEHGTAWLNGAGFRCGPDRQKRHPAELHRALPRHCAAARRLLGSPLLALLSTSCVSGGGSGPVIVDALLVVASTWIAGLFFFAVSVVVQKRRERRARARLEDEEVDSAIRVLDSWRRGE
jgi:hypothetical protein